MIFLGWRAHCFTYQFTPVEREQVNGVRDVQKKYGSGDQKIEQRDEQYEPYPIQHWQHEQRQPGRAGKTQTQHAQYTSHLKPKYTRYTTTTSVADLSCYSPATGLESRPTGSSSVSCRSATPRRYTGPWTPPDVCSWRANPTIPACPPYCWSLPATNRPFGCR